MANTITSDIIHRVRAPLDQHPVYQAINSVETLRCFMEHHIYSVWDFMSLIKYLQGAIAPTTYPWAPRGDGSVRRFINELVLEEESDQTNVEGEFSSHYELYQRAMAEIGADTQVSSRFVAVAAKEGIGDALALPDIPEPSREFTRTTFGFINNNQPHQVAAALALGREHIIPAMFRQFLRQMGIKEQDAPIFYFYLNRHIHLDEDFHAPLSLRLLNSLCGDDEGKTIEAIEAAQAAVAARTQFWDGVLESIKKI